METTMTTMRITLPTSDTRFLKRLSGNMGWSLERASASEKSAAKVQMTKEEFCAKIRKSSSQKAQGQTVAMQAHETSEQFINRMLCI